MTMPGWPPGQPPTARRPGAGPREETMRRRDVLRGTAGFVSTLALAGFAQIPAFAQGKTSLKASDVHPAGYPTVVAVENLGKKLEQATNGRLGVQMFGSMQLGGEKEAIEQAQVGALQMARVSVGAIGPVIDGAENNPPSFVFDNHYQVAKNYTLTEHLIVPEILVFSRKTWDSLSKDDQALIRKFAGEAQAEERVLWAAYEKQAMDKAQTSGVQIVET